MGFFQVNIKEHITRVYDPPLIFTVKNTIHLIRDRRCDVGLLKRLHKKKNVLRPEEKAPPANLDPLPTDMVRRSAE